jgi:hypothetical protein
MSTLRTADVSQAYIGPVGRVLFLGKRYKWVYNLSSSCSSMFRIFFVKVLEKFVMFSKIEETWTLILSEEHKLTVFENRVLRRICGPKRDEVTGFWRKLHN